MTGYYPPVPDFAAAWPHVASGLQPGDRVIQPGGSWRPELPANAAGTVLRVYAGACLTPDRTREDAADVRFDDYAPPCGYDTILARFLVSASGDVPAEWLDGP